jgi:predicted RNase H-like HicB family nuclease
MQRFLVVIEKAAANYSAYSPDVLGCITTGATIEETLVNMREALEAHLECMALSGDELPSPRGVDSYIDAVEMSEDEEYFITHLTVNEPQTEATALLS